MPPGGDLNHALLLKVYGFWTWPRWSWPPESNLNHSLLLSFTSFVPTTLLKNHSQYLHGVTLIMPYSLRSMASGHGPDGHGLQKPTQTIDYYCPLQVLFLQLCWKLIPVPQGGDLDNVLLLEVYVYGLWTCPRWPWPLETTWNHSLLSLSQTFVLQVYQDNW